MKRLFIVVFFISVVNIYSQQVEIKPFRNFQLSFLGGTSFNSIPTLGGTILLEGNTKINNKLSLKLSVGYSGLFENVDYTSRSYKLSTIENIEVYTATSHKINNINYSMIPLNIGVDYVFFESEVSPIIIFDFGINNYNGEQQIESGGRTSYMTYAEIPDEFKTYKSKVLDGNAYTIGLGTGINYQLSQNFGISIRYMFRYNDKIINSHQMLVGMTF